MQPAVTFTAKLELPVLGWLSLTKNNTYFKQLKLTVLRRIWFILEVSICSMYVEVTENSQVSKEILSMSCFIKRAGLLRLRT